MGHPTDRPYRTAAFAALAGVTVRALHHYDRLGLLKPRRSSAGYRLYSERDLETLEEIVALKFIGVPLKAIGAIRRQPRGAFVDVLSAQREALEARRDVLNRAVAAVAAAEATLRSGATSDASLFRRIMEVMHMDRVDDNAITRYSAILKSKLTHVTSLSEEQRAALRGQWSELVEEVRGALDADPAGPRAQRLLDRWVELLQSLTGTDPAKPISPDAEDVAFRATPQLRDALWARRAEWLPADAERQSPADVDEAFRRVRDRVTAYADAEVIGFIARARAARTARHS